jgi:PASTA domain
VNGDVSGSPSPGGANSGDPEPPTPTPMGTDAKSAGPGDFVSVPDLTSLSEATALDILKGMGMPTDVQIAPTQGPCGVVAQDPVAGSWVHRGTRVTITLGRPSVGC